jgi:hypothetical protein
MAECDLLFAPRLDDQHNLLMEVPTNSTLLDIRDNQPSLHRLTLVTGILGKFSDGCNFSASVARPSVSTSVSLIERLREPARAASLSGCHLPSGVTKCLHPMHGSSPLVSVQPVLSRFIVLLRRSLLYLLSTTAPPRLPLYSLLLRANVRIAVRYGRFMSSLSPGEISPLYLKQLIHSSGWPK